MSIFKKPTKRAFVCGYCGGSIDKANEPDGKIIKKDGKPACAVCRATKFSSLSDLIKGNKKAYEKDKKFLDKKSQADALKDIKEVAFASQIKAEKDGLTVRISPKKFLK